MRSGFNVLVLVWLTAYVRTSMQDETASTDASGNKSPADRSSLLTECKKNLLNAEEKIYKLQSERSRISKTLRILKNERKVLKSKGRSLQQNVSVLQEDLKLCKLDVDDLTEYTGELQAKIKALNTKMARLKSYKKSDKSSLIDQLLECEVDKEALDSDLSAAQRDKQELQQKVESLQASEEAMRAELKSCSAQVAELPAKIISLNDKIANLTQVAKQNQTLTESLQTEENTSEVPQADSEALEGKILKLNRNIETLIFLLENSKLNFEKLEEKSAKNVTEDLNSTTYHKNVTKDKDIEGESLIKESDDVVAARDSKELVMQNNALNSTDRSRDETTSKETTTAIANTSTRENSKFTNVLAAESSEDLEMSDLDTKEEESEESSIEFEILNTTDDYSTVIRARIKKSGSGTAVNNKAVDLVSENISSTKSLLETSTESWNTAIKTETITAAEVTENYFSTAASITADHTTEHVDASSIQSSGTSTTLPSTVDLTTESAEASTTEVSEISITPASIVSVNLTIESVDSRSTQNSDTSTTPASTVDITMESVDSSSDTLTTPFYIEKLTTKSVDLSSTQSRDFSTTLGNNFTVDITMEPVDSSNTQNSDTSTTPASTVHLTTESADSSSVQSNFTLTTPIYIEELTTESVDASSTQNSDISKTSTITKNLTTESVDASRAQSSEISTTATITADLTTESLDSSNTKSSVTSITVGHNITEELTTEPVDSSSAQSSAATVFTTTASTTIKDNQSDKTDYDDVISGSDEGRNETEIVLIFNEESDEETATTIKTVKLESQNVSHDVNISEESASGSSEEAATELTEMQTTTPSVVVDVTASAAAQQDENERTTVKNDIIQEGNVPSSEEKDDEENLITNEVGDGSLEEKSSVIQTNFTSIIDGDNNVNSEINREFNNNNITNNTEIKFNGNIKCDDFEINSDDAAENITNENNQLDELIMRKSSSAENISLNTTRIIDAITFELITKSKENKILQAIVDEMKHDTVNLESQLDCLNTSNLLLQAQMKSLEIMNETLTNKTLDLVSQLSKKEFEIYLLHSELSASRESNMQMKFNNDKLRDLNEDLASQLALLNTLTASLQSQIITLEAEIAEHEKNETAINVEHLSDVDYTSEIDYDQSQSEIDQSRDHESVENTSTNEQVKQSTNKIHYENVSDEKQVSEEQSQADAEITRVSQNDELQELSREDHFPVSVEGDKHDASDEADTNEGATSPRMVVLLESTPATAVPRTTTRAHQGGEGFDSDAATWVREHVAIATVSASCLLLLTAALIFVCARRCCHDDSHELSNLHRKMAALNNSPCSCQYQEALWSTPRVLGPIPESPFETRTPWDLTSSFH